MNFDIPSENDLASHQKSQLVKDGKNGFLKMFLWNLGLCTYLIYNLWI